VSYRLVSEYCGSIGGPVRDNAYDTDV
jgi:hypothetical protein